MQENLKTQALKQLRDLRILRYGNGGGWRNSLLLPVILLLGFPIACRNQTQTTIVNFAHLEHLTEQITMAGDTVDIVHVYANYPDYRWVSAKESGPEGIACVDDAARAAVVYMRDFELHHRQTSLDHARRLLRFVLAMQDPDGQFYNFIYEDHAINTDGKTSFKSFGWWAARGVWSLGHGYRVFKTIDSVFARRLGSAVERSLPHVHALLRKHGQREEEGGFAFPRWLLHESAADATSELLLGLVEYWRAEPSDSLRDAIRRLADGLALMQNGDIGTFPFGLHRSWRTQWHLWGNSQTQVLAMAGRVLGDSAMISSARREADGFYTRLLCEGLFKEMDLRTPDVRTEFEQIAYGIRPMAVGLIRLYEATGNADYARLAGVSASWLFGNNAAGTAMYDPATGRCYDGIQSSTGINRNSGAESTIEALGTLIELEAYPEALAYAQCKRVDGSVSPSYSKGTFELPGGERFTLHIDAQQRRFWFEER